MYVRTFVHQVDRSLIMVRLLDANLKTYQQKKSNREAIWFFLLSTKVAVDRTGWLPSAPDPCALGAASVPPALHPCPVAPKIKKKPKSPNPGRTLKKRPKYFRLLPGRTIADVRTSKCQNARTARSPNVKTLELQEAQMSKMANNHFSQNPAERPEIWS